MLGWGSYLAMSRAGVNDGLHLADFLVIRFGVAGALMLPLLAVRGRALAVLGIVRCVALTAVAGPLFIVVSVGGYRFAPLAHGAVVQPVTVTVVVTLVAAVFMGETLHRARLIGVVVAILGAALVGFGAPGTAPGTGPTWVGDAMFAAAGLLYASFTLMLRAWRVDPVLATGVISVLSAVLVVPWFLATDDFSRILALPPAALALQVGVQGVISGVVAILAFGITVKHLGASRAALFPSMVPAAATLMGIPLTHEFPAPLQALGMVAATIGLLATVVPWGGRTP